MRCGAIILSGMAVFALGPSLDAQAAWVADGALWSQQFGSTSDWESAGGRRYTTFGSGAGGFDGDLVDGDGDPIASIDGFISDSVGTTNNNSGGNNPGPGFAYIPTGLAWEPDTTYSIDFIVLQRAGQPVNSDVQYGLWAGLPTDDTGPGDYNTGDSSDTFEAQTRPSLGTEGLIKITAGGLDDGDGAFVSAIDGVSLVDVTFSYTTPSDVSGLDEMVFFVRTDTARIHWDSLSVIPEPGSLALLGLGGALMLARRRPSA